jgi:hypothetical protein
MQVPSMLQRESLKRLLQGAAAGAFATMFVGSAVRESRVGNERSYKSAQVAHKESLAPLS